MSHLLVLLLVWLTSGGLVGAQLLFGTVPQRPYPIRRTEMPTTFWKFIGLQVAAAVFATIAVCAHWMVVRGNTE